MNNIKLKSKEELESMQATLASEIKRRDDNKFLILQPFSDLLQNNKVENQKDVGYGEYDQFGVKHSDFVIREYKYFTLALNPNQSYLGRCLLIMKPHYSSPGDIPEEQHKEGREIIDKVSKFFIKEYGENGMYQLDHYCCRVASLIYDHFPEKSPWPNNVKILSQNDYRKLITKIQKSL